MKINSASNVINELRDKFADITDHRNPVKTAPHAPEQTAFFPCLTDALNALSPEGSTVRAFGFDSVDDILRAGYRIADDGAADIAVVRGGECEAAVARRSGCKRLLLCPVRDLTAAASPYYRTTDRAFAIMRYGQKPDAVVFDCNCINDNLAGVFGEIVALDLCAFDLAFGACMRGERMDVELVELVAALVDDMVAAVKPLEKRADEISNALIEFGKRAARLVERTPELLHASGAAQAAEALRMLYVAEDRTLAERGEVEMLLCGYIISFYIKNISADKFCFPPNNTKRTDCICEYLGADIRRACVYAAAMYPPEKLRLCEYRYKEFRSDILGMLVALRARFNSAWRVFKRLHPDDGYGLKNLVDPTDFALCIALAPDVFAADSMLSFFKQKGLLEKYLLL